MKNTRRITIIEVVAILAVAAILSAAVRPVVMHSIRSLRMARAERDVRAIRDAVLAFLDDVQPHTMVQNASPPPGHQLPVELAVGDGDIPKLGPDGDEAWLQPVDYAYIDFLEFHLVSNNPGNEYEHGYDPWRGAYMTAPVRPDPWGNRYMVNVLYLHPQYKFDVVVLSAGPDGHVDSEFTRQAFEPGGDDIICLVKAGPGADPGPPPEAEGDITVCNETGEHGGLKVYADGKLLTTGQIFEGECDTYTIALGSHVEAYGRPDPPKWNLIDEFIVQESDFGTTRAY